MLSRIEKLNVNKTQSYKTEEKNPVKKIAIDSLKTTATEKKPASYWGRISTLNKCLILTAVALKVTGIALIYHFGPIVAAQHGMAFLIPGLKVMAFFCELMILAAMPIVMPILSTLAVTAITFAVIAYLGCLALKAIKPVIKELLIWLPDCVLACIPAPIKAWAGAPDGKLPVIFEKSLEKTQQVVTAVRQVVTAVRQVVTAVREEFIGFSHDEAQKYLASQPILQPIIPDSHVDKDVADASARAKKEAFLISAVVQETRIGKMTVSQTELLQRPAVIPLAKPKTSLFRAKPKGFSSVKKIG